MAGPPSTLLAEPAPLDSGGGRWRVAAGALGGMALSAALVGGGYAFGVRDGDEPVPVVQESAATPAIATPDQQSDAPATTAPPLTQGDEVEPVTAVARALSPSVVRIDTGAGQGSGIVWDAANGYIVTNDHVTSGASNVSVLFDTGVEVSGVVIGGDSARDIAVVQVDPDEVDLVAATFAPTETVEVGALAVAVGSPFGLDQSVTAGIVSAVNRINIFGGSDPANPVPVAMIQTDAPINPGNSGGALANRDGHVIGMNTSIRTESGDNAGVGFAVPSDTIVLIAERIVNGESLELGFLGVSGDTPTDGSLGALVTDVVAGRPAEDAGIEIGDLIISVNGSVVATMEELAADFKLFRPGEQVDVEVLRNGERVSLSVTVGSN
ncbi:MAG: trypsin-like peptidase domain-containing protein [Actinomycetota bacterium]